MAEKSLKERLADRISQLENEIARVHTAADQTELELRAQISLLERANRAVNPETESLLAALKAQGIL